MDPVATVLQPRNAFPPIAQQPRVHALAADPVPLGDLGHRNPAPTSSTARYLCSVTLNSHSMSGVSSIKRSPICAPRACDNFLYGFKGAPSARHAYGRNRLRELARATGESRSGRVTGDKRRGSPGVSPLLGGSFRRALRAEALRRDELPRTAAPAPAAAGPRRHAPMPRHTSRARPSRSRRVRRSPYERSQPPGPERRALSRSAPPASRAPQDPF